MWSSFPAGAGAGGFAPDAGEEAVEGVFVGEAVAEVDPGESSEKARNFLLARLAGSNTGITRNLRF
jgi:hypothetical protein